MMVLKPKGSIFREEKERIQEKDGKAGSARA
jgi:hypothetical protein